MMIADKRVNWPRRISLAVLAVYWVALFVGTHVPRLPVEFVPRWSDKVMHAAAFGGLAFLLALAWSLGRSFGGRAVLAVLAIVAAYGAVDEATQPFIGRTADTLDWLADLAGAAVGLAVFAVANAAFRRSYGED